MFVPLQNIKRHWNDYNLILASVSVGNVGQLAIDLLIYSLNAYKIGYMYHNSILPLIGNDPYIEYSPDSSKLMTSCEVYEDKVNKLVIIQQRTPFAKGRRGIYRKLLLTWIKTHNFKLIVNFTGSFSYIRNDKQIQSVPLRFLCTPYLEEKYSDELYNKLKWIHLEESKINNEVVSNTNPLSHSNNMEESIHEQILKDGFEDLVVDPVNQVSNLVRTVNIKEEGSSSDLNKEKSNMEYEAVCTVKYTIPGGGISQKLFLDCCKADLPLMVLLKFCDEGDNTSDAIHLANYFNQWAKLVFPSSKTSASPTNASIYPWKIPPSWKLFFGSNPHPNLMY